MRKGLLFSFIALAMFIATTAGANVKKLLDARSDNASIASVKKTIARASNPNRSQYRSPVGARKVVIDTIDTVAVARARSRGAVEIADYGSFKLFVMDDAQVESAKAEFELQSSESHFTSASQALNDQGFAVRDDFNLLLLRSGHIDTTAEDAAGNFIGMGDAGDSLVLQSANRARASSAGKSKAGRSAIRLIQFIGPVKRAWLDAVQASGLEIIAYVPNNAYLVRGPESATSHLMMTAAASGSFIQWEGMFVDEYKIHPALKRAAMEQPDAEQTVAIQIVRSREADGAGDVKAARALARSVIGSEYDVLNFTNLRLKISARKVIELAAVSNVVNIEPWSSPQLADERSSQIIAAKLTSDGKESSGPGYMQWLAGRGFNSRFNFVIDVSDTGIDRGSIAANTLHPDFLDAAGQSRVVYARDYTSELDAGDVPGHGTINLSIAGGASDSSAAGMRDASGYNYGLGVAPYALLGSSKIFQSTGKFDLVEPYTKLVSDAYRDGARVSSNSWAAFSNSYTIDSQEYDARARDAMPSEAGNQEFILLFAAGNNGFIGSIGSPGTAKNVISVAASENSRKDGTDGCLVRDNEADSALDMAGFSSAGPLDDGRMKPDIAAPGTHITGAASQHPEFDGLLVCGMALDSPYFPSGQKLYTWSSGTSHATPQVAGAAALVRQFFINQGMEPNAALIKALLLNTTTYMTGTLAGGNLPHPKQGWGLINIDRAFNGVPKIFVNQSHTFNDSGQEFVLTGEVKDPSQPFRVTLAYSDAPGFSGVAPWVNNLDLEVIINGQVYRGNNLVGEVSRAGGEADTKNNVEAVWLPAGTVGTFAVRVRATTIAGDGIPANIDFSDQDFALVVYNGEKKDAAVAALAGVTLAGGADEVADPGETVSMKVLIADLSPVAMTSARATLTTVTAGVTVTAASADLPNIAAGQTGESATAFVFTIDRSVQCGAFVDFVLEVTAGGLVSRVPFQLRTGRTQAAEFFTDDVESGEAKWTHGSLVKKKKNRIDTWKVATKRFRSGANSWFTPDLGKATNANLDSIPIQLPADGRDLQLVFFHTFEFESGMFDGGVIEISAGSDFEDLGPKILRGGYNGVVPSFITTNALAGRAAWVEGRHGELQQVVVDLSSYAGKTVIIRFRIGTDQDGRGIGWYVDDVRIAGNRVTCAAAQ